MSDITVKLVPGSVPNSNYAECRMAKLPEEMVKAQGWVSDKVITHLVINRLRHLAYVNLSKPDVTYLVDNTGHLLSDFPYDTANAHVTFKQNNGVDVYADGKLLLGIYLPHASDYESDDKTTQSSSIQSSDTEVTPKLSASCCSPWKVATAVMLVAAMALATTYKLDLFPFNTTSKV